MVYDRNHEFLFSKPRPPSIGHYSLSLSGCGLVEGTGSPITISTHISGAGHDPTTGTAGSQAGSPSALHSWGLQALS